MRETILLTGGAGFIGSHTAVELIERGCRVVIVDDLSNSSVDIPERIGRITGSVPELIVADAADKNAMERVFAEHSFDAVVHFAGLKAVGESVGQPVRYYRNNLDTTLTLLELMEKFSVRRIVFSSSATVYGDGAQPPYSEDMSTGGCTNPYGWTKYMSERILTDAAAAGDISAVLLRYFNPIGAHRSGLIGERPNGVPNNLMPYITQTAAGIRERLSIFGDDYPTPDGTGVRDYIHVCDLARGHAAALDYSARHSGVEAVNLGTGRGVSVLELVKTFERVCGVSVPYSMAPRRAGDAAVSFANVEKAQRVLGWRAELGVEDMCRDAWNWQKNCENRLFE